MGFGFQARLFDLLFLEGQGVLHGVSFRLGLQHAHRCRAFRFFHRLHLGGFGFQLGDLHLLGLHLGLYAQAFVLLLFEQQSFQPAGILRQHDLFHDDSVMLQLLSDSFRGQLADLFAFCREDFAHSVVGREFAEGGRHHRRNDFPLHRLRQIGVDEIQTLGIELVADGDGHPDAQPFFRLDGEVRGFSGLRVFRLAFTDRLQAVFAGRSNQHVVTQVVQRHRVHQRHDQVHSGIKCARARPRGLTHSDAAHPAGHHHNARGENEWQPGPKERPFRSCPIQLRFTRRVLRSYMDPLLAVILDDLIKIVQRNGGSPREQAPADGQQQVFQ